MPRGALTLPDVRSPTIEILCEPCGRRGRYNVERLMSAHGHPKLTTGDRSLEFSEQAGPDGERDGVELRSGVEFLCRAPDERLDRRLAQRQAVSDVDD
jgi:hypothetical protein